MTRRFGQPPESARRYRRRPGVYAVISDGRDVLMTWQAEPVPEFQLPGGGIDPGESPVAALHREVLEETGWRIGRIRRLGAYRRFTYMPEYDLWAEKLCMIYLARPVCRHGPPLEPGHAAVWFTPELAVEALASDGDRHFLRRALEVATRRDAAAPLRRIRRPSRGQWPRGSAGR
ncbi:8-oxo-dGTP diphosphatase [Meinhardsimonia xiamenensis]|jgi:8-oxo-dGTP diphosphatase|uniref:8-oxo-dGTP diphosphatase n=1 Tax=Meinhardsimonia xiamenensis TaxID=990712 RepID=A0A1G8XZF8_9RHOB|nr:8-oxo-dGTP diphosphatase [Meinhardsimonia xiamenensis]SDJ95903.1 8-oxo-dGTP diphosphatase [Meinhardsimonia xiamenensis]